MSEIINVHFNITNCNIKKIIVVKDDDSSIIIDEYEKIKKERKENFVLNGSNIRFKSFSHFMEMIESHVKDMKECKRFSLDLSKNNLNTLFIRSLIIFLGNYKDKLYYLNLSYNSISPQGIKELFNFLSTCTIFSKIDCDNNFITSNLFYDILYKSNLSIDFKNRIEYNQISVPL